MNYRTLFVVISALTVYPTGVATGKLSKETLASMREFENSLNDKGIEGLQAEFRRLQRRANYTALPHNAFLCNMAKNSYNNIFCYDQTRVRLEYEANREGDYIHANYVESKLINLSNVYICTQGPTSCTLNDFWRMVWQTKANHIVKLCQNIEDHKVKCIPYFPETPGQAYTYDTIGVLTQNRVMHEDYETIKLVYWRVADVSEAHHLTVYRWLTWPDHGVPSRGLAIFRILDTIRSDIGSTAIIHCSAGVGRTGTFMAAAISYEILLSGIHLKVPEVVREIRNQRSHMVQTADQYVFLNFVLIEYIKSQ